MVAKESDYSFCSVVGRTDVGCRRPVNEDSIGKADTLNGLAVVICDGMGGHVGGKVASETAVNAILMHLKEHQYADPKEAISNSIIEANHAVLKKTQLHPELTGMGCTCVLLLVDKKGMVYVGHVGDSRIYLIRDGIANHLTKDQSYVQMLVDEGTLTPQEAERHPRSNEITNAVGMENMTPPVVREQALNPTAGDCFLLCSDGLSKVVPEKDIVKIVESRSFSTDKRAEMLINEARNNGGPDNISVQLVEFSVSPSEVMLARRKKRIVVMIALTMLIVALLFILLFSLKRNGNKTSQEKEGVPVGETIAVSEQTENKSLNKKQEDSLLAGLARSDKEIKKSQKENVAREDSVPTMPQPNMDQDTVKNIAGETQDKVVSFGKSEPEITIPLPSSGRRFDKRTRKLSKELWHFDGKPSLKSLIDISEDDKGGLKICKKKLDEDWSGSRIIIDSYLDGGDKKTMDYKIIVIFY